jgi:hypothetical protein
MQISADFDSLHAQLLEIRARVEKKLVGMVQNFTYNLAVEAIETTPFNHNFDETRGFYFNATRLAWGLGVTPGHAKGGWMLSMNSASRYRWNMVANGENATNVKAAADDASMEYKLGDDVFIVNNVPYVSNDHWPVAQFGTNNPFEVKSLESGYSSQAPEGISKPVIAFAFSQDLRRMYEQA